MPARTRPILPSADLTATADFYSRLGFGVLGRWPNEYLILTGPDEIELHFWHNPRVTRRTNDVGCWIGYPSVSELMIRYDALAGAGVPPPADLRPPVDDGRLVEFPLIDLFGNLLRFGALSGR